MKDRPDFLHVHGPDIVNGRGEVVRLRGFCLGGWMNMENFITGYPGDEAGMRAAVRRVLGAERARFFFERFLHYFFAEDDVRYLKSLGCNVIRVALNYRHFESDERPLEYQPEGLALLDRLVGWARAHQVYVILDLHAVQGWQNQGWHSDNHCQAAHFWGQRDFESRALALWQELARRYRDEEFVAGYNVMNEPNAADVRWLNQYYRRVTRAIREVDPQHIIFLEGNHYSQQFHELEAPFDNNTVYSSHLYVPPGLDDGQYPGQFGGEFGDQFYGRQQLEQLNAERAAFMRQHGVPHWLGEFGCIYGDKALETSRLRVMTDWLDILREKGDHWTIWTYKDIGKMGLVYADPDSEWMCRTRPVREAKTALRCDNWIERQQTEITGLIRQLAQHVQTVVAGQAGNWENLVGELENDICEGMLAQKLLPAFAEQFSGMSEKEIDSMMQSFAFQNCIRREGLAQLIHTHC
jgi:hypothetical protein